jgi:hypothetical protein
VAGPPGTTPRPVGAGELQQEPGAWHTVRKVPEQAAPGAQSSMLSSGGR